MTLRLIQNTSKHDRAKRINNDATNVPCQRRKYFCIYSHRIMPIVTLFIYFFELQSFLEKDNYFVDKSTTTKENVKLCTITVDKKKFKMLEYPK
jgi:hypothetical protein